MISLKEVSSAAGLSEFVKFPFTLYKNCEFWVPPIIKEERANFDKSGNPVFENADAWFFLAQKEGRTVGRIAVIINWLEVKQQGIRKIRFGWFDFEDDPQISELLLSKVEEIGKSFKLDFIEGPMGFTNLDKVGVLTDGFNSPGTMITWYNYPYYKKHYERLGFSVEKTYVESRIKAQQSDPEHYRKIQELIKERYGIRVVHFKKSSEVMPWAYKMFELFNKTYSTLPSYVPVSKSQIEYFKRKYLRFIYPEYIKFVLDKSDNLIAFAIVMPSYSEALKKANGRLFPWGIFYLNEARKKSKDVLFYLIGIHPEYQNKGITAPILYEFHQTFSKKGIVNCYRSPELENNLAIHKMWKYFNPEVYKKRCTYKKTLIPLTSGFEKKSEDYSPMAAATAEESRL